MDGSGWCTIDPANTAVGHCTVLHRVPAVARIEGQKSEDISVLQAVIPKLISVHRMKPLQDSIASAAAR